MHKYEMSGLTCLRYENIQPAQNRQVTQVKRRENKNIFFRRAVLRSRVEFVSNKARHRRDERSETAEICPDDKRARVVR